MHHQTTHEAIRMELAAARTEFHALLDSLSETDLPRQSLNPGWTNGEILAHMTFGFIVTLVLMPMTRFWGRMPRGSSKWFAWTLNTVTGPFNWINALGARMQGRLFTYKRMGRLFDRVMHSLLKQVESIKEFEWERGMFYPRKWDSNFDEFMTLEKLFHYPVIHFRFHLNQISR